MRRPASGLDLTELDAVTAHLDLVVDPTEELERRRRRSSRHTSPVRYMRAPGAPANGSGTNRSAVSSGRLQVAAGHALAADVQLARHADRHRLQQGVEHVAAGVGDRPPDRHRSPGDGRRRRRPGAPSTTPSSPSARRGSTAPGTSARHRVDAARAASASPPYSAVRPGSPVQPSSTSIRHVVGVACITVTPARAAGQRRQPRRIEHGRPGRRSPAGPRAATAGRSRAPRGRTTTSSPPARRRRAELPGSRRHRPARKLTTFAVLDLDALGPPGRARGVDHVGQLATADRPRAGSSSGAAAIADRVVVEQHDVGARLTAVDAGRRRSRLITTGRAGVLEHERQPAAPGSSDRAARTPRPP